MASAADKPGFLGDRDLAGYGGKNPDPQWPNESKIAISFVLNYEEGSENCILNGDPGSEYSLTEFGIEGKMRPGDRHLSVESTYEYGSRQGVWRILNVFKEHGMVLTCYAVGKAIELNPQVVPVMEEMGCELASHAYRWIDYHVYEHDEAKERELMYKAIKAIENISSDHKPPVGWYTGRDTANTRRLVQEVYDELGYELLYNADCYNDDLPYWIPSPTAKVPGSPEDPGMLMLPYTFENNDMRFDKPHGFKLASDFFQYLKDSFDTLYEEGCKGSPKMMTIGLHCRLIGRPGRIAGLKRFMEYIKTKPGVWVTTRRDIAKHWRQTHPYH